jgi:DNA mismatch repair protein MutS2
MRRQLADRRDRIEHERIGVLSDARREAEDLLIEMRREIEQERRRIATRQFDARLAEETLKQLDSSLAGVTQRARPKRAEVDIAPPPRSLAQGDHIHVRDIPQEGVAMSGIGEDGRVEVQFGSIRMKVSVDRIDRVESAEPRQQVVLPEREAPNVAIELDLRGQRAEEAMGRLETYIDDAYRAGMPFVRIIHGKGTGALRAATREALTGHPLVRRLESAAPREGGDGVTVAVLAG